MAKLSAYLHGQMLSEIDLVDGQEYIIGRGEDCSLVLPPHRGISRQHIKVSQKGSTWCAESMSRFVPLHKEGEPRETVELRKLTVFSAPPYELHFDDRDNLTRSSQSNSVTAKPEPMPGMEDTVIRGNLEATVAGSSPLVPYLRMRLPNSENQELLRLEGAFWIAGRESSSEIRLPDKRASRRHFELSKSGEGYFITDLGSSNGTRLNGQKLPPHEPTRVDSGDTIKVLGIEMMFEIRDSELSDRLLHIPRSEPMPAMLMPIQPALPVEDPTTIATALEEDSEEPINWKNWQNWKPSNFKKFDWKKNKVRVALLALIPVVVIGLFQNEAPPKPPAQAKSNGSPAFDKLTPDQKNSIKDSFNLARNLYIQGKYELCLAELAKVDALVPAYENSKELETFCNQGRELVLRQQDLERRERERALLESKVGSVVDDCKQRLKDRGNVNQVRQCLAEAIELSPDDSRISEMIDAAQARASEEKLLASQRAERHRRTEQGEAMYRKAKDLYKTGHLSKSISAYDRFLRTAFPDMDHTKDSAKREVASVKMELAQKVALFLAQCKALGDKGRFKDAYKACDQAVVENPSNDEAKDLRAHMLSSLRRDLKDMYEDSVLDESLGNVDSAKEKWRKIIQDDLDFDEYSVKSKINLRKYGVEL